MKIDTQQIYKENNMFLIFFFYDIMRKHCRAKIFGCQGIPTIYNKQNLTYKQAQWRIQFLAILVDKFIMVYA